MKALLVIIVSSVTGGLGWWLGARIGLMTAFLVSIAGTAIGVYLSRKWIAQHLD